MEIGPNKYQLYGKVILLSIATPVFALLAWYRPSVDFSGAEHFGKFILGSVVTLLILLLIMMALQLFLLPFRVVIDEQRQNITLYFLTGKKISLSVPGLSSFSRISIATRSESYNGVLITANDGKAYVLGNFHLSDISPLDTLLQEHNIPCTGKQQFSIIRYFLKKYDNR
ncbi:hypothetical protein [Rurimicrobium arvi]|uniref:Bacterial Pleckstrin homology domain-containing protein n=1 Tax=Rurimicrobium arvi TaxID=2049916 RepID=A0ABP8MS24_9BACT